MRDDRVTEIDDDITVELELDDGRVVVCNILTILEVDGKDYIVLLPEDEEISNGEVWIYGYSENPDDPDADPELRYIEDDDEYEIVADAFDEWQDDEEFEEL